MGVLLALCFVLPLTWWLRVSHRIQPPPPGATADAQRAYWQARLKADISDREAYTRLGVLEEQRGYYTAAVRYLQAARALGAPDSLICPPLGRALTQLARDDEALPELEKAARLAPASADAAANLAGLYVNQEHPELAAAVLKRFVSANPDLSAADANRIALALLECSENAAARDVAERRLGSDPNDLLAQSIAARGALAAHDYKTARERLEKLLKASPNEVGVLYLYGNTLDALGDHDKALLTWQKAVDINPKAVDIYERIGGAYLKRKDYPHAATAYEALAERVPSGKTAGEAAVALEKAGKKELSAYWAAVTAGFSGRFPEALRLAKVAAASSNPQTRRLGLGAVAEAYRGMRMREPYMEAIRQRTAGGGFSDLLELAQAYEQTDQHEKRTECLERAVQIAPADRRGDALYLLGQAYSSRGMLDRAEKALEEAASLSPKNPAIFREMGRLYFERRGVGDRLNRAIDAWSRAAALEPDESEDWQHLGVACTQAHMPSRAVFCLEHAIDLEPGSGPAYLALSNAEKALGDNRGATQYRALYAKYVTSEQTRQTLRTRARRPGATASDARAYADLVYRMGALDEAAKWYEKTLALEPSNDAVRQRLIRIYGTLRRVDRMMELTARDSGGGGHTASPASPASPGTSTVPAGGKGT